MLSFVRSLKSVLRLSNAVAVITFPPSLVSTTFSKRLQHLADTLVSVKAIPGVHASFLLFHSSYQGTMLEKKHNLQFMLQSDEDKELAKLLTGYQDMVGLLSVHKVARINTQVFVVASYSLMLFLLFC